ncbi:MAG: hypothetical protein Fur0025_41520 [Oscillatoriaceae cyanobacterium]
MIPIVLTEAFGCNRCQQIFVVQQGGYVLDELATSYPYKRSWLWNGKHWRVSHPGPGPSYFLVVLLVILAIGIVVGCLSLNSPWGTQIVPVAIVLVILGLLPALLVWLAYRH